MIRELGASVLHDDLLRRIAGRLELTFAQAAALASEVSAPRAASAPAGPRASNGSGGGGSGGSTQAVRSERLFLGLCIAVPEEGARALNDIKIDELLTSAPLRRAARHLADHARTPLAELPAEDDELARTMSGLVDLAGRVPDPTPDRLEHTRLVLELEQLDRAIIRARHEGVGTSALARDRETVRESMRSVVARMESTLWFDPGSRAVRLQGREEVDGQAPPSPPSYHALAPVPVGGLAGGAGAQLSGAGLTLSLAKLGEEAAKCVLLCSNCHAEVEGGVRTLVVELSALLTGTWSARIRKISTP
jgi:hypothetical protein